MANEAVIIQLPSNVYPVRRTIADGSAGTDIEKGTIMKLADPNTVSASTGTGDIFGGILAEEKVGGDGATTCSCHLVGVFDLTCNAGETVTGGTKVTSSGANLIRDATEAEVNAGKWIGVAEEDGAVNEVIRVRLRGY